MSNTPPDSSASNSGVRPGRLLAIIFVVIVLMGVAAFVTYRVTVRSVIENSEAASHARLMEMTGMANPVAEKLDARYTDADHNLIADRPTDPSQLIDPPTLVFSYVAQEQNEAARDAWKPFMDALAKATGKPVEYLGVSSIDDQLIALRDGKLQVTGFNSGAVPTAVNLCGYVPVCRIPTSDPKGTHIEIIVPAGSDIHAISDLKDRDLTLTDYTSNTGFKAPLVLLRSDFGLEPERDYHFRTSGGHEESIRGVASKNYQAAAVAADMIDRVASRGDFDRKSITTIYKSESFPSASLGYAYNLTPALEAKIKEVILNFNIQGTALAKELGVEVEHFPPVNYREDWSLIRRIDDAYGTKRDASKLTPTSQPSTDETLDSATTEPATEPSP